MSASEVVSSLRTSVSRPDCSCRPGLHLFLDRGTNGREAIAQAVGDLQANGTFGLLQAHGGVGGGRGELGGQSLVSALRLACKLLVMLQVATKCQTSRWNSESDQYQKY